VHHHDLEHPLLEVVNDEDLQCMEEVLLREVTHTTATLSKHVESLVNLARPQFSISCLGVGITECTI